jgi:hypothetical protein
VFVRSTPNCGEKVGTDKAEIANDAGLENDVLLGGRQTREFIS